MRSIVYLISGPAHLPYLLVSLKSLRRYWTGRVQIHCWPESWPLLTRMLGNAPGLDVVAYKHEPELRRKDGVRSNSQFFDKIQLMMSDAVGDGPNLYLDADSLVAGDPSPLLDEAEDGTFVATQFNRWLTSGKTIRGRLESLKEFGCHEISTLVDHVTSRSYPSVNGGVFACRSTSLVLPQWWSFCSTPGVRSTFIADEKCLHLFNAPQFHEQFIVMEGGRWNCSPKHRPPDLPVDDVVIWHGHGDSFVRPHKAPFGHTLWWIEWSNCLADNLGGCRDWWADCGNKHLNKLMGELV